MAEKRDIELLLTARADVQQILNATTALNDLEAVVDRIRKLTNQPLSFAGLNSLSSKAQGAAKNLGLIGDAASATGKSAAKDLTAASEAADAFQGKLSQTLTLTKQVSRFPAKGDPTQTQTFEGPRGSGITRTESTSTGAVTITENEKKANAERLAEQKRVLKETEQNLQKELNLISSNASALRSEKAGILKDEIQSGGARIAVEKRLRTEQEREGLGRIALERRLAADQKAQRSRNLSEQAQEAVRNLNTNSFNRFAQGPGVTIATRQAVNSSGGLTTQKVATNALTGEILKLNEATGALSFTQKNMAKAVDQSSDSLFNAAGKVLLWTIATGAVFGAINSIKSAVGVFAEVEQQSVALQRVGRGFTDLSADSAAGSQQIVESTRNITNELLKLSVEYGTTGTEAQQAAVQFARLGQTQSEVLTSVKTALLAANVANISAADSANLLVAALSQFQLKAGELPGVLNKLNELENTTKVRTLDLLQSVALAGSVFREAGGSFEELAATTAVVSQATARSGSVIGNAMKTIASRLGDATIQAKIFATTGVGIANIDGELRPINDILGELVVSFQNLTQAERVGISTTIAGIRQRNILQSALDNYFQIQEKVIQQLRQEGSASKENEAITGTLAKKLEQLVAAFRQLAVVLVDSGIGSVLKTLVDALTGAVTFLSSFGKGALVVVLAIGSYIAAVVIAAASTTSLGGTVTATAKALFSGITSVNALAASYLGLATAAGTAAAAQQASAAAAANPLVARAAAASGPARVLAGPGFAAATPTAAAGIASLSLPAAAIAAVLFLAIRDKATKGNLKEIDTKAFDVAREKAVENTGKAENALKLVREQVSVASTASKVIAEQEKLAKRGQSLDTQQIEQRIRIGKSLVSIFQLEGEARQKALEGTLTSIEISALANQARRDEEAAIEKVIRKKEEEVKLAERLRAASGNKLQEVKETKETQDFGGLGGFLNGAFNDTDVVKAQADFNAAAKAEQEALDKLKDSRESFKENKQFKEQFANVKEFERQLKSIEQLGNREFGLKLALSQTDLQKSIVEIRQLEAKLDAIESEPSFINLQFADPEKAEGIIEELENKLEDQKIKINIAAVVEKLEFEKNVFNSRVNLRDELIKRSVSNGDPEFQSAREENALLSAKLNDLKDIAAETARIDGILAKQAGQTKSFDNDVLSISEIEELQRKRNILQGQKSEIEKDLPEQQVRAALAELDAQVKITNERKKQAQETRDALGQLDDFELIQARILLGSVQNGTQKAPSAGEFLNFDQNTRKLFNTVTPGLVPQLKFPGIDDSVFIKKKDEDPQNAQIEALRAQLSSGSLKITAPGFFEGNIDQATINVGSVRGALPPVIAVPATSLAREEPQSVPSTTAPFSNRETGVTPPRPPDINPPVGALNLNVDLGGVEAPMDQLANNVALRIAETMQELIDANVARAAQPLERKRGAFTQFVRA